MYLAIIINWSVPLTWLFKDSQNICVHHITSPESSLLGLQNTIMEGYTETKHNILKGVLLFLTLAYIPSTIYITYTLHTSDITLGGDISVLKREIENLQKQLEEISNNSPGVSLHLINILWKLLFLFDIHETAIRVSSDCVYIGHWQYFLILLMNIINSGMTWFFTHHDIFYLLVSHLF